MSYQNADGPRAATQVAAILRWNTRGVLVLPADSTAPPSPPTMEECS